MNCIPNFRICQEPSNFKYISDGTFIVIFYVMKICRLKSSFFDFGTLSFGAMKIFHYTEMAEILILQNFLDVEKARLLRIKSIVLIFLV